MGSEAMMMYTRRMDLKLDLSEEVLFRLHTEAERRQLSMGDFIKEMLGSLPVGASTADIPSTPSTTTSIPTTPAKRDLSFIAIGSSTSGRRASEADEMLSEGFGID